MRNLIVAAACLCRGLTADETQQVADIITAAGDPQTAAAAHELLESTIADVIASTRGVIFDRSDVPAGKPRSN